MHLIIVTTKFQFCINLINEKKTNVIVEQKLVSNQPEIIYVKHHPKTEMKCLTKWVWS